MPPARPPKSRRRRPASRRATPPARPARPSRAERRLLDITRELTTLTGTGRDHDKALVAAVEHLAAAYAPPAPLAADYHRDWLASRNDKTAALALAWAREQVRMVLEDLVRRRAASPQGRLLAPPEVVAWLVLAACEALASEPPAAAADRTRMLLDLVGP